MNKQYRFVSVDNAPAGRRSTGTRVGLSLLRTGASKSLRGPCTGGWCSWKPAGGQSIHLNDQGLTTSATPK